MNNERFQSIADDLQKALDEGTVIDQISVTHPGLTMDDAYAIQLINHQKELAAGRVVKGKKIGLTSKAMQDLLKVDQPDFGFLYDYMDITATGVVPRNGVCQPKVEGELAFVLKESLSGDCTAQDVYAATEYIVPAIEIVGSRIRDWKLTLVDTVADNASCGMYLYNQRRIKPGEVDLKTVPLTLYKNDEKMNTGVGAAVMGDPANAVAWLAKCLGRYGITLDKGDFVLAGALTAAVSAIPGDTFIADFGQQGTVSVRFE